MLRMYIHLSTPDLVKGLRAAIATRRENFSSIGVYDLDAEGLGVTLAAPGIELELESIGGLCIHTAFAILSDQAIFSD